MQYVFGYKEAMPVGIMYIYCFGEYVVTTKWGMQMLHWIPQDSKQEHGGCWTKRKPKKFLHVLPSILGLNLSASMHGFCKQLGISINNNTVLKCMKDQNINLPTVYKQYAS